MAVDDFVMTIDSDAEDDEPLPKSSATGKSKAQEPEDGLLNPEFSFDLSGDPYADFVEDSENSADIIKVGSRPQPLSVDEIIARRIVKAASGKRKRAIEDVEGEDDEQSNVSSSGDEEDDRSSALEDGEGFVGLDDGDDNDPLATSGEEEDGDGDQGVNGPSDEDEDEDDGSDSELETQAEKDRKAAFFASDSGTSASHSSFLSMNLSRPILKALTSLSFHTPTPIQAATIPVALLGKDVVGNAVTGSGKTAAFIIPMLERLLYRDRGQKAAATRCLILVPTRELGVQCFEVGSKLAAHTDVRFCLAVGGLSVKSQEAALRTRPDVVIATPGRLIDHLRNSVSFNLDALDVLVLDEADRMLSDGFHDELTEIIKSCPTSRQTMLFSATMTDSVDELVKMSLNKPVRLFVDPKRTTAKSLIQEFVRVRAGKEAERSALLVALCKRTFKSGVIVFFRSKKLAHQIRIVFSLLGMKCQELHGDLTQEQRLKALQAFRDGTVDYLMATDLASRGLDIKGVDIVINYDMPGQLAQYLHRVGRTARAGKKGRSVTLVGEADRKMLKAAMKHSADDDQVRHRIVPPEAVAKWSEKLESLKSEIAAVLQEEKEEKQMRQAEMELKKGENIMEHESEIFSRPARTWFQSTKEKAKAESVSKQQYESGFQTAKLSKQKKDENKPKRDKFSGLTRRAKRRKMAIEEEKTEGETGAITASIRSAKKLQRPAKIGDAQARLPGKNRKSQKKKAEKRRGSAGFDKDMSARSEGVRAKKGDTIGRLGKKGAQPRKH